MFTKKKIILIVSSVVIFLIFSITAYVIRYYKHMDEIERVIGSKGGEVISVKKIDSHDSPFKGTSDKNNIIYKIEYQIDGVNDIAWYRAMTTVTDIHHVPKRGYPEGWLFFEAKP